jgi:hypothetical protein
MGPQSRVCLSEKQSLPQHPSAAPPRSSAPSSPCSMAQLGVSTAPVSLLDSVVPKDGGQVAYSSPATRPVRALRRGPVACRLPTGLASRWRGACGLTPCWGRWKRPFDFPILAETVAETCTREQRPHTAGRAVEAIGENPLDLVGWLLLDRCPLELLIGLRKGCHAGVLSIA